MITLNRQVSASHGATITCKGWRQEAALAALHVEATLEMRRSRAVAFDCGGNTRARAEKAGVKDTIRTSGFVPEYIRPRSCEGEGRSAGRCSRASRQTAPQPTISRSSCSKTTMAPANMTTHSSACSRAIPGIRAVRHADAGYREAIATATRAPIDMPMSTPGGAGR